MQLVAKSFKRGYLDPYLEMADQYAQMALDAEHPIVKSEHASQAAKLYAMAHAFRMVYEEALRQDGIEDD